MTLLLAWLIVAATLVWPLGKHVFNGHGLIARAFGGCILALIWPWCLFMLIRKAFLTELCMVRVRLSD